jgi:CheY-like chemotaxis protein
MAETSLMTKKILYVDDDKPSRCLMEIIIEEMGHTLAMVSTGEEAVEKIKTEKFDLIIMDIRLPSMNGYDTTRTIRRMNKEIPIIAFTAHVMDWVPQKCKDAGMDGFLSKPLDIDTLKKTILDHLRK